MSFLEVFEPGLRHWREHLDREKMLVVTDEAGGTGPDPLDLDSGSVVLKMPSGVVLESREKTELARSSEPIEGPTETDDKPEEGWPLYPGAEGGIE